MFFEGYPSDSKSLTARQVGAGMAVVQEGDVESLRG